MILIPVVVLVAIISGFFIATVRTMKQYPGSGSIPVATAFFSIMIAVVVGIGISLSIDHTWSGNGVVVSKQHSEERTEKVWSGKLYMTRVVPECYGLSISPDGTNMSQSRIVNVCISQESWDKVQVNQDIAIGGEKGVNFVE